MNIELVSPQCTVSFEYHQKWIVIMLAPVGLICLALIGYAVLYVKKAGFTCLWRKMGWTKGKKRKHGNLHRHANALIGATILMFQFVYIYCTKTAYEPFACIDKEDGKSYMRFEPKIRCGEGHHLWLAPMGMVFGCLYGIGIPLIFTYIVYRNRNIITNDQVLRALGTGSCRETNPKYYEFRKRYYKLYYRFKPKFHYWGQVILLRKFLVVLCTVFLKSNPTLQATCALMILFISYSVHIRALPYLRNDLLGADDTDMEKASKNSAAKTRWANLGNLTRAGTFKGADNDGGDGERQGSESTAMERALSLINKNPKSMSVSRSLKKKKDKMRQVSRSMSRRSMPVNTATDVGKNKGVELVNRSHSVASATTPASSASLRRSGSASEQKKGGMQLKRAVSMYGIDVPEAEAGGRAEDDGNTDSMATNTRVSKNFLMDYNTMETIFHFCSILILLCALMFESGSQGDLGGGGSNTAKKNAELVAAPTLGDAPTAGAEANEGAEHYLLVVFVISVVALSSIYFMFALLSEVVRSFSHFARVMKQRKQTKKRTEDLIKAKAATQR
jgi:hypothetical protein